METNYNRKNRRKYSLNAHIVLVTKYRKLLLKDIISEDIKSQTLDISHKYNSFTVKGWIMWILN